MIWITPSEMDTGTDTLGKRLRAAAGQFRANSGLSAAQYSQPVLCLIFLRFAEVRFAKQRAKLEKTSASSRRGSRVDEPAAYHAEGILYLAPNARCANRGMNRVKARGVRGKKWPCASTSGGMLDSSARFVGNNCQRKTTLNVMATN